MTVYSVNMKVGRSYQRVLFKSKPLAEKFYKIARKGEMIDSVHLDEHEIYDYVPSLEEFDLQD